MYRRILPLFLIAFSAGPLLAQQSLSTTTANTIGVSNTSVGNFYYSNRNEPARAIEFKGQTVTYAYFRTNINTYFSIPAEFTFVETESSADDLGMQHHFLQQYYKGTPVEGMNYRVHEKDGFVTAANGRAIRNITLNPQVSISEDQAFRLAVRYLHAKDTAFRNSAKLIASKNFTYAPESFSIAFQFDIDVSLIERWRISIDASTGEIVNKISLVNSCLHDITPPLPYDKGTGATSYYGVKTVRIEKQGTGSRLVGQTEHGGNIGTYDFKHAPIILLQLGVPYSLSDFQSNDNTYFADGQQPAVSAQWAVEQAYEYYFKKRNRKSFDNKNGTINVYAHVDQNYDNALWTGTLLIVGDGSHNNPLVELDVISHELTHGVTQYEASLQYANESGALNESFSDIMGKTVEFYTFGDTATWQLARHYQSGGIRDMSNPNLRSQPDTYFGDMWSAGAADYGGVHTNSGVQNFWYYLLCKGGSGTNDHQVNYSVNAIGIDAAASIVYRNLTEYLSSTSDYLDSRIGSLLAATDLYGKNSTIYQQVEEAWDAVGVIEQPVITTLSVYDITGTTAKIKGSLLPMGNNVTYHFEYGTTPAYGTTSSTYTYSNTIEGILTMLQSATKYYLRLVATNENGTSYNATEFTTAALAPMVKLKPTVDITETNATLYGQVNPNSLSTSFYFEYGLTPAFGLVTPSSSLPISTEFQNVSVSIANLQSRKTYYYRLVGINGSGTSTTASATFFTAVKPVINSFTPVSAPVGATVVLSGTNFNVQSSNNLVMFGATAGTVLSSSATEIKVQVPGGASFGTLSLLDTESGLRAESIQEFVPTFAGGFDKSDMKLMVGSNDLYFYKALVCDMDGDGKPDIVARHYQGFSILENVNQGGDITNESFVRSTFTTGLDNDAYIGLADFDGNGLTDVVVHSQLGLRIFPNRSVPGYIFFDAPVDLPIGYFYDPVFHDFDQDGHIDIAIRVSTSGASILEIFRNLNPKDTPLSADNFEQHYAHTAPDYVSYMTSGDLNNDGNFDVMHEMPNENYIYIQKNKSTPNNFNFDDVSILDPVRGRFTQYLAQDLNQDGWKDILSTVPNDVGNLAIFENNKTSPSITTASPVIVFSNATATGICPADVNGDGKVDLVYSSEARKFIYLQNNGNAGAHFSSSSFSKIAEYSMFTTETGTAITTKITVNDLNGDGRPEVISTHEYNYSNHDGYQLEIWQNSKNNCIDPSRVTVKTSKNSATIVLPTNTTLDQFEIDFSYAGTNPYWTQVTGTTLSLYSGYSYQLRVRAKCGLDFTDYYYINFAPDCVDVNNFSLTNIGIDNVALAVSNYGAISAYEIQYSRAGQSQWTIVPQYTDQITGLLPGTAYDVRCRGRCTPLTDFTYSHFTTLCPSLTKINITNITYNQASIQWTSNFSGQAILEYSIDNVNWMSVNGTLISALIPGTKYTIRGKMACTDLDSDFIYASFTTACPTITLLYADNITPFSARVTWTDNSNTHNYSLTYAAAGGPATTVETTEPSFDMQGLIAGTLYTISVTAKCNNEEFTTATFSTLCYTPFDLSVTDITHTSAELSWKDNFGGPYLVDCTISGSDDWRTKETTSQTLSLANLRPATAYDVRVHINCSSAQAYASVHFTTDIYGETTFAPNPTDDAITIYPAKNLIGIHFSIYDNAGRELVSGELTDYTIHLSNFATGFYTLKIDGEKIMKIVKY